jgi:hypothetical protein
MNFFCKDLWYVSIKTTQGDLKKCMTWPKNLGQGVSKNGRRYVSIQVYTQGNWIL